MRSGGKIGEMVRRYKPLLTGLLFVLAFAWLGILQGSDAFFGPYLLYGLAGLAACYTCGFPDEKETRREKVCGILFSAFFGLAILLANYRMIDPVAEHLPEVLILLPGGYILGRLILRFALNYSSGSINSAGRTGKKAVILYLASFLMIAFMYAVILFFCYQPGVLTFDSIYQIDQVLTGVYTNHHPFWHTMIIKAALTLGMRYFGGLSDGVIIYNLIQILFMASIFAYIILTLYQSGVSRIWIGLVLIAYMVIPYHILCSMTMWKDIPFAGAAALFMCSLYRLLKGIGGKKLSYCVLAVAGLGCCLWRSNGLAAFVLTFLILAFVLRGNGKGLIITLLGVIAVSFILKYPVLNMLNVQKTSTVEYLSIPAQQFARLLVEKEDLDESDVAEMEKVMDTARAREVYRPTISDPVKGTIRGDYVKEHKFECFMTWLRLGLKYPDVFLRAWIDQTRGYWNGGYQYWVVTTEIRENEFYLWHKDLNNAISRKMDEWYDNFFSQRVYEPLRSIGLHNWILALCATVLFVRKRKEGLICVFPIAVILTLLISTPVFSEFRYDYAVFTSFPLVVLTTFTGGRRAEKTKDA